MLLKFSENFFIFCLLILSFTERDELRFSIKLRLCEYNAHFFLIAFALYFDGMLFSHDG